MKIGFIGLGKMGSRMVLKLIKEGHELVVWNRSPQPIEELKLKVQSSKFKVTVQNLKFTKTIKELTESLKRPKIVWSMVPAGESTETILQEISKYVEKDDIVIDGGNAFYKDTEKRYQDFKKRGVRYLGIGVSGGIIAAKDGYPMMVGGDKSAYEFIKPILDSLAKPHGGHEYFGEGGAGHFVKMVHNGIEYGIMQSIGEGFGVLDKAPYKLDFLKVAKLYKKGTLISGFFMDRTVEVLERDPRLNHVVGMIGSATGETVWMVQQAREEGVGVEIIERSLEFRRRSQKDKKVQKSFSARLVAALRNAFGGHSVVKRD